MVPLKESWTVPNSEWPFLGSHRKAPTECPSSLWEHIWGGLPPQLGTVWWPPRGRWNFDNSSVHHEDQSREMWASMVGLEVWVQDSVQPAWCMVAAGNGIPEGRQEVEAGWSGEGCDLLEISFFEKAPLESRALDVEVEDGEPFFRDSLEWVQPYCRGRGEVDNVAIVWGGKCYWDGSWGRRSNKAEVHN